MAAQPRRAVVRELLTAAECAELVHIARCCGAAGFRDNCCVVNSTVIARVHAPFLIPLAQARDRVRDAVERHLGLDLSLFVEFTGLISWRPGAAISWHRDDNRPYLAQRAAAAVVYLNAAGRDFEGGGFAFRDGDGREEGVAPATGTAVLYATSEEHRVAPAVATGERFTLAMWFATDPEFDEDRGILAAVGGGPPAPALPAALHALPGDGTDMRLCRLACHGVALLRRVEGEGGPWRALRRLEDGDWEAPGPLRIAILAGDEGLCDVGDPLAASVRLAVWGAQRALLRGDSGDGPSRECVCSRHVSEQPEVVEPLERFGSCVSSCLWLAAPVEGGAARPGAAVLELRQRVEAAIREYADRIEPAEAEVWTALRAEWLRAGAVWGPASG